MGEDALTLDLGPVEIDQFARFWSVWPRRVDRARAEVAFRRALRIASPDKIVAGAEAYARQVEGRGEREIATAVHWLGSAQWRPQEQPQPSRRRRRRSRGPVRAPHRTSITRPLSATEQKQQWLRQHGVSEAEYEAKKGDPEWVALLRRRGRVA